MCSRAFTTFRSGDAARRLRAVLVSPDPRRLAAQVAACRAFDDQALCLERRDLHQALFSAGLEDAALIVVDAALARSDGAGLLASLRRRAPAGMVVVAGDDPHPLQRALERLKRAAAGGQP